MHKVIQYLHPRATYHASHYRWFWDVCTTEDWATKIKEPYILKEADFDLQYQWISSTIQKLRTLKSTPVELKTIEVQALTYPPKPYDLKNIL